MFAARGMQLAQLELPSDVNDFFQNNPAASLEFTLLTEAAVETMGEKQNSESRNHEPE
jgi:hypothetical protein